MLHDDEKYMNLAIDQALKGKTPYGCVITNGNDMMITSFNTVKKDHDPTAHAEINAIRQLGSLAGYRQKEATLYSTAEPCPMCMGAIIWAGIRRVVFGVSIDEISRFQKQIRISSSEIAAAGFEQTEIISGILHEECLNLFKTKDHDQR